MEKVAYAVYEDHGGFLPVFRGGEGLGVGFNSIKSSLIFLLPHSFQPLCHTFC